MAWWFSHSAWTAIFLHLVYQVFLGPSSYGVEYISSTLLLFLTIKSLYGTEETIFYYYEKVIFYLDHYDWSRFK